VGAALVGLDYLSVAHADEQVLVHRAFLDHGVILLEGIDLSHIAPGRYELICFPLRLRGSDGAPCRAVLRDSVGMRGPSRGADSSRARGVDGAEG
jgi:arylformamidase